VVRDNHLLARLRAGKRAIGSWLQLNSATAAEVIGLAGYDCALIDQEHSPGDIPGLLAQLQALAAMPTTPVVRVPWNDPIYLKRVLDVGAEGVMVPMVQNAEEAARVVAACRYPPKGMRGIALSMRASNYGMAGAQYLAGIERNLLIICQIETASAVQQIEAIAAVDGVDMVFIGLSDLVASIGRTGQRNHPDVIALIKDAEARMARTGKWAGAITTESTTADELYARGYHLVIAGADVGFIREGATRQVAAFRERHG
jgi:4-hydroxy-2-oxoheptanedioate aldolase